MEESQETVDSKVGGKMGTPLAIPLGSNVGDQHALSQETQQSVIFLLHGKIPLFVSGTADDTLGLC